MKQKFKPTRKSAGVMLIVAEIIAGTFLSISSFLLFLTLARQIDSSLFLFDQSIVEYIYRLRSPLITNIMFITTFFGGLSLLFFSAVIFFVLLIKKHKHEAVLFSLAFFTGFVINVVLKEYFARARPDISPLSLEILASFPSGHAMNSFVFYSFLVLLIHRLFKRKITTWAFGVVFSILVLLIGASRIYLGVHYPSDVVAGFVAAFFWAVTVLVIEKTLLIFSLTHKKRQQLPH